MEGEMSGAAWPEGGEKWSQQVLVQATRECWWSRIFWECGLGSSPDLWWKALIHLGAFREQILAWRLSLRWFSLKIGINSLIEPAWSASSLLPRGVRVSGMGVLGAGNGLMPGRNFSSQELSGWEFLLSKIHLGPCRKLHFCHCSARPST